MSLNDKAPNTEHLANTRLTKSTLPEFRLKFSLNPKLNALAPFTPARLRSDFLTLWRFDFSPNSTFSNLNFTFFPIRYSKFAIQSSAPQP